MNEPQTPAAPAEVFALYLTPPEACTLISIVKAGTTAVKSDGSPADIFAIVRAGMHLSTKHVEDYKTLREKLEKLRTWGKELTPREELAPAAENKAFEESAGFSADHQDKKFTEDTDGFEIEK